jgi:hypothetical protein
VCGDFIWVTDEYDRYEQKKRTDKLLLMNDNSTQVGNKEGASKMLYRAISFSFCSVEKQRT